MPLFLRQILTCKDNATYEMARVLTVLAFLVFIGFSGYDLYQSGSFDAMNWAISSTTIIFGGSAGVRLKANAEGDKEKDDSDSSK